MNVLDENILESQRQLLINWRIPFRQIGFEVGRSGLKDDEIIPLLLTLRQPTFFTLDADFYKRQLCHARYALIHLDVADFEAATFVRRFLRQPEFNTQAKRLGVVIRASHAGLNAWRLHAERSIYYKWID